MIANWVVQRLVSLTLVCLGLIHLVFYFDGTLANFLHPFFRTMALGAGIILTLLAIIWPFLPMQGSCGHEHHECHDHGLSSKVLLKFGIILIPILICASLRPSSYSITAIQNRGIMKEVPGNMATSKKERPTSSSEVTEANVVDLLYIARDAELRKEFEGKRIKVMGQVASEKEGKGAFNLIRMVMVCCAADARPAGLKILYPRGEAFKEMSWVEVEGMLRFVPNLGQFLPEMEASEAKQVNTPSEKFLY